MEYSPKNEVCSSFPILCLSLGMVTLKLVQLRVPPPVVAPQQRQLHGTSASPGPGAEASPRVHVGMYYRILGLGFTGFRV